MTCSVVQICKRFGGTCCLHYQIEDGESVSVVVDYSCDEMMMIGRMMLMMMMMIVE